MAKRNRIRDKKALAGITAAGLSDPEFVRRDMERRRSGACTRHDSRGPRRTGSRSSAKASAIRSAY